MALLSYYMVHTFVNAIKKLFKTWVAIFIGIMVFFGLIGGIIGVVIGTYVDEPSDSSFSQQVEEDQVLDEAMMAENTAQKMNVLELAAGGIILAVFLLNLYGADKNGANIFTMADVNFLFTAPKKPQSVLLFRVVLQMGTILLGSIYLIFQLPNLIFNLGLSPTAAIFILLAWFLSLVFGKLISVCTYTITATHVHLRKYVRPLTIAIIIANVALLYLTMQFKNLNVYDAGVLLFTSEISRWIPMWGWIKGFIMYAVEGNFVASFISLFGVAAGCALFAWIIWNFKADFYEDALSHAAKTQEKLEAVASGKRMATKRSKKIKREGLNRGEGANIFLFKSIYNRRRFAKFGVFTSTSITYLLICIGTSLVTKMNFESNNITVLAFMVLAFAFFRNFGNPIAIETDSNFIFMIPENPRKKIWYAILAGVYDTAMDITPWFIVATVILQANPLISILWIFVFISVDLMASSTGLFIEMCMPTQLVRAIKALFQMSLKIFALMPTIILLIIGTATSNTEIVLFVSIVFNATIGAVLIIPSASFLHSGRK